MEFLYSKMKDSHQAGQLTIQFLFFFTSTILFLFARMNVSIFKDGGFILESYRLENSNSVQEGEFL